MKKIQKIFFSLFAAFMLFTVIQTPTYASSLLDPPALAHMGLYTINQEKQTIGFAVTKNDYANGASFELYKGNTKVGTYETKVKTPTALDNRYFWGSSAISYNKNTVYKYRVRYYKIANNQMAFGSWSGFRYFVRMKSPVIKVYTKKGLKITLYKCSNVTKFVVYLSKKSSTSGYKKVKTIKVGSKNKKSFYIKKNYNKTGKNYIKIIPYIEGYGASDIVYTYSYSFRK